MLRLPSIALILLMPILAAADADDPNFRDAAPLKPSQIGGDIRFLHPDGIHDASFSRDGKCLVTVSATMDNTFRLWDLKTGQVVQRFRATIQTDHQRPVLSPDNSRLYTGRGQLVIWDVATAKVENLLPAQAWTLSYDGKLLVTLNTRVLPDEPGSSKYKPIKDLERTDGFDVKTFDDAGKPLRTLLHLPGSPLGLALSRDGKTLVVRSDHGDHRRLTAIDTTAKIPQGNGTGAAQGIGDHLALSADGRYLAVSAPYPAKPNGADELAWITVVDLHNASEVVHRLNEHRGEINHLEFLADGRLVSAGRDASFIVWRLSETANYTKHSRGDVLYSYGASLTSDGRKALLFPSDRANRPAHLLPPLMLDLGTGEVKSLARVALPPARFPEPKQNAWEPDRNKLGDMYLRLPDGRWLLHRNYLKQQLWLLEKNQVTKLHEFVGSSPNVHVSGDGKRLYQVRPERDGRFPSTYWRQGERYTAGSASYVAVFDLENMKETAALAGDIPCVRFWVSPDERTLAVEHADQEVRIWDTPTNQVRHRLELPAFATNFGGKAWFSPDSKLFLRETVGVRLTWSVTPLRN